MSEVEPRQHDREHVGHPQQPGVAEPDRAHHVEFGRGRQLAERQQDAQHQAERDRQAGIFGHQVGEHLEHDADRPALRSRRNRTARSILSSISSEAASTNTPIIGTSDEPDDIAVGGGEVQRRAALERNWAVRTPAFQTGAGEPAAGVRKSDRD